MIGDMVFNIMFIVLGVIVMFGAGWLFEDKDSPFVWLSLLGIIVIGIGCLFIHIDTKNYYEKYIPNLQEQVLQGKMLELENELKELE